MKLEPRAAFLVALLVFCCAPGHGDAWLRGIPLGLWTPVGLTIVGAVWWASRHAPPPRGLTGVALALAMLAVVKIAVAAIAPSGGWLARYYANATFSGAPRRSTEFARLQGATRIDRAIDFRDDFLPAYFLNDPDFNGGIRREVTEPVSVVWTGYAHTAAATAASVAIDAKGDARITLDGRPVIGPVNAARVDLILAPGDHVLEVTYVKPANTDPLVRVSGLTPLVTARPVAPWRSRLAPAARVAARAIDILAIALVAASVWMLARGIVWSPALVLTMAMLALFAVQGTMAAAPLVGRAESLSGGDDWMAYEGRSRAVATGDFLMMFSQPYGKGEVLYFYPGYTYFLAAVHAIGGEDRAAIIFVQFLLLFAANVVVYWIGARVFGRPATLAALGGLVAIEQLDFVRHYTVTLLTENLYVFTTALTLYACIRFVESGSRRMLIAAAVAAGVSALTRPAMMLFLVPGAVVVLIVAWRRQGRPAPACGAAALFVAVWLATVSPATIRNYVAAGSPVLICESPVMSFINYNLPSNVDGRFYRDQYSGTTLSLARILGSIVVNHPMDTLRNVSIKLGFSFGMVQWMGGRVHPELVLASIGYLLAIVLTPSARLMPTWPIHAFVLAHLAGMVLSMPSNYGYRLILPMYLFFPLFGARLVSDLATRFAR